LVLIFERRVLIRRYALFILCQNKTARFICVLTRHPCFQRLYEFQEMKMVMGPEPRWWLCFLDATQ